MNISNLQTCVLLKPQIPDKQVAVPYFAIELDIVLLIKNIFIDRNISNLDWRIFSIYTSFWSSHNTSIVDIKIKREKFEFEYVVSLFFLFLIVETFWKLWRMKDFNWDLNRWPSKTSSEVSARNLCERSLYAEILLILFDEE